MAELLSGHCKSTGSSVWKDASSLSSLFFVDRKKFGRTWPVSGAQVEWE